MKVYEPFHGAVSPHGLGRRQRHRDTVIISFTAVAHLHPKYNSFDPKCMIAMARSVKRRRNMRSKAIARQRRPQGVKRKQWSNESMIAAMDAVKDGTISINKTALLHGIPPTTLNNVD